MRTAHPAPRHGFTLIELLVVMSIIATLLTLAMPRYFHSLGKSKEAVLRENLHQVRDAIDKFYGDHDQYPQELNELVSQKYLRSMPEDPLTESTNTWVIVVHSNSDMTGVYDIKSGAAGSGSNGVPYKEW